MHISFVNSRIGGPGIAVQDDATVRVTNAMGTGKLQIEGACIFLVDRGTVVADALVVGTQRDRKAVLELSGSGQVICPQVTVAPRSELSGAGQLIGQLLNRGTVVPAPQGGRLRITGSMQTEGAVRVVWNGRSDPADGPPMVTGQVSLAGGLSWRAALPNFRPSWTNEFVVMQWGDVEGAFTNAPPGARLPVGAGSFRVYYRPDALVLADYREDRDGDGVDDLWAETYFGHSPLSAAQRAADDDGDGMSNAAEAVAGTDPHDAASVFRIVAVIPSADGVRVRFTHAPGKWYRVWRAETMGTWREVEQPQFTYPAGGVSEWVDGGFRSAPRSIA